MGVSRFVVGLLAMCVALVAQESKPQTQIVLLGTVHDETPNFTQSHLENILKAVGPDVVLLELDSSFFNSESHLLDRYRNLTLETRAAVAYQATSGAALRPYEIEGRNRFYQEQDYFSREAKMNQEIDRLYNDRLLSPEAQAIMEALKSLAQVRDACMEERPEVINSAACDSGVEHKQFYAYKGLRRIVDLTGALSDHKAFSALSDEFWVRRNETMARNIGAYAREFRGKRIVVLCGFEHRYYLRRLLTEHASTDGFVLREFWEY